MACQPALLDLSGSNIGRLAVGFSNSVVVEVAITATTVVAVTVRATDSTCRSSEHSDSLDAILKVELFNYLEGLKVLEEGLSSWILPKMQEVSS